MPKKKRKSAAFNLKTIGKWAAKTALYFIGISVFWVLLYKVVNPPLTYLMVQRALERKADDKSWKIDQKWKDVDELSFNLKKAAIAGEDANFLKHHGFDFEAIQKAFQKNQKGNQLRGGSTISQQTAKNVFLWPGRSYVRKAFEAYFTFLIELFWSKNRILEVYLNVIEMGDGIYGAESACQAYYHKSASSLSKGEAALLVAVLPNPRRWSPAKPTAFIYRRQSLILKNMRNLGTIKFK